MTERPTTDPKFPGANLWWYVHDCMCGQESWGLSSNDDVLDSRERKARTERGCKRFSSVVCMSAGYSRHHCQSKEFI